MPTCIITKRVTMTETAWERMRRLVDDECSFDFGMDISDAQTALAEAETLAVTDTYSLDETSEIDAWVIDATNEGRDVR